MDVESIMDGGDKIDEIMLPGFRFHPTDEELVGFYLKRKTLQRPLSIELIKQLDIYKYDPWDLPKLATTGEKEWYFYCPRDRKYRNSARPNRVTIAGFWKATGTDRPIYSSESSKCIGLKKSLVFYKGRAAKGTKTDWMMHEFRLPSTNDSTTASRRFITKDIPANDAWAICRIFKKVNSTGQRGISHFWGSPTPTRAPQQPNPTHPNNDTTTNFSSDNNMSLTSKTTSSSLIQFGDQHTNNNINHKVLQQSSNMSLLDDDHVLTYNSTTNYNQINLTQDLSTIYTTFQTNNPTTTLLPNSCVLGDFGSIMPQQPMISNYTCPLPQDLRRNYNLQEHMMCPLPQDLRRNYNLQEHMVLENEWSHDNVSNEEIGLNMIPMAGSSLGSFALNFPLNFVWDSMPCPSDVSSTFSTNKHYV